MSPALSIRTQIESSRDVIASLLVQEEKIATVADVCVEALRTGKKILTCGNGGSAADAMHLAEELVARYRSARRALPALSLSADPSVLTCIANDFGWEEVFVRQVEAHGRSGDVLVAFTTSGMSENINRALLNAKGFIQRSLGRHVRTKYVPEIHFVFDDSVIHGIQLENLMRKIDEDRPEES